MEDVSSGKINGRSAMGINGTILMLAVYLFSFTLTSDGADSIYSMFRLFQFTGAIVILLCMITVHYKILKYSNLNKPTWESERNH